MRGWVEEEEEEVLCLLCLWSGGVVVFSLSQIALIFFQIRGNICWVGVVTVWPVKLMATVVVVVFPDRKVAAGAGRPDRRTSSLP